MTPRQQVEQAIREACPELQELKFGCLVEDHQTDKCFILHNDNGELITYAWAGDIHSFPAEMRLSDEDKKRYRIKRFSKNDEGAYEDVYKILGSPIHLEHVMRAIEVALQENEHEYADAALRLLNIQCGKAGHFTGTSSEELINLSLPFEKWSDELINFLHPILCVKE